MYYEISDILHQEGRGQVNAIMMGDFNSIVGERSTDKVVGPFGHGRRNERGKMLIDFYKQHDLVVMNTWFKKKKRSCTHGRAQETGIDTKSITFW